MSEHLFDVLTRHVSATGSRRGSLRVLAGLALGGLWDSQLTDAEARKGGRKRGKGKKNKRKNNRRNNQHLGCTPSCDGKTCGDDGCGGSCGTCAAGQLCAQGRCVTGLGTCPIGTDACSGHLDDCGLARGNEECRCWTTMANETRCGAFGPLHDGHSICTNDAQCAVLFPDFPGAFCVQQTGDCITGGQCYAPCPR